MFYVPILFSSLGTGDEGALLNAVIIGALTGLRACLRACGLGCKLTCRLRRSWHSAAPCCLLCCVVLRKPQPPTPSLNKPR